MLDDEAIAEPAVIILSYHFSYHSSYHSSHSFSIRASLQHRSSFHCVTSPQGSSAAAEELAEELAEKLQRNFAEEPAVSEGHSIKRSTEENKIVFVVTTESIISFCI